MVKMHNLLKRQIKRHIGDLESIPSACEALLNAVNDAYWQMDLDREMLERSLELSSQELLQANSEMRAIFQSIPDLIFRLDCTGTIIDCKGGSATDFLFEPERMFGRRIQDIPLQPVNDQFQEAIRRVREEKTVVSFEYSLVLQGKEHFYEARLAPLFKDQIMAIIRSTTNRRQAEEAQRRLVAAIEQCMEGIYLAGTDWIIEYANPAFINMTGYEQDEIIGWHTRKLKSDQHGRAFYRNIRETLARGEVWSGRASNRKKDGTFFDAEVTVSPVRNSSGKITNYVGIHRDISNEIKLERQLNQAQKLESIGTLAGGIAHDFNNLLMGILGYASLLMMDMDGHHPHFEKLKAIESQVQSGAELTRQLLGFARAGRYEVKPVNLNDLIRETAAMFARTKKEISLQESYSESPWTVEVDRGQIEQVLLNLFVNAWQAMPEGGELYLETRNISLGESYTKSFAVSPGRYVKVSVTDTGTGMDEKTQQRIFDPFFTTKEMGRGTGLGLASAYGIIKGHGGLINVYSEKGHGTTFNIYLPASRKEMTDIQEPSRTIQTGREVILIVDDEKFIVDVAGEMLRGLGYHVLSAGGSQEAVELFKANRDRIDLVILDMVMPGLGGGETYLSLKAIKPGIRVILCSGYSINGQAREIMDQGVNAFLQKPFSLEELSQTIRDVLAG